jgi:hypothetical protein
VGCEGHKFREVVPIMQFERIGAVA